MTANVKVSILCQETPLTRGLNALRPLHRIRGRYGNNGTDGCSHHILVGDGQEVDEVMAKSAQGAEICAYSNITRTISPCRLDLVERHLRYMCNRLYSEAQQCYNRQYSSHTAQPVIDKKNATRPLPLGACSSSSSYHRGPNMLDFRPGSSDSDISRVGGADAGPICLTLLRRKPYPSHSPYALDWC